MVQPSDEGMPHMFGIELVLVQEDAISHAQPHRCIISPHSYLAMATLKMVFHNSIMDVHKSLFYYPIAFFLKLHELSTGT
jgi:hypothetical protein